MFKRILKQITVCACVLCSVTMCIPAYGKEQESFEQITDTFFENEMNENNIAGAAVVVVRDGRVLFEKGYGYADLKEKKTVDAKTTAFQIASVSKLFTATAVMQLVEEGKLSLDEDVNHYLKAFQVKNPYSKPVTLRTLLCHTSGIDDRMPLYIPTRGEKKFADMPALEQVLKENIAPVVHEPGTVCQYNVFGMALVGYIVEAVSQEPFDQYVTNHIMSPIGMTNSLYGLSDEICLQMSKPYQYHDSKYELGTYTLLNDHPSGAICASVSDMGKFLIAHMNHTLLSEDTEKLMQTHQTPDDERLTGYSLGFYEEARNGHKTLAHGGYLPSFASKLSMLPDEKLGLFVVLNTKSQTSNRVINKYIDCFYNFYTENDSSVPKQMPFDMNSNDISGQYAGAYGVTDFTKIKSVLETTTIQCDKEGNLTYIGEGEEWKFYYIGDGMFYCKSNGNYLRIKDLNGKQMINVLGSDFIKVSFVSSLLFKIVMISVPILLITIIVGLVMLIRKRKGGLVLLQSLFILFYLCLNGIIPFCYVAGNTVPIQNIVKPLIPIVCIASVTSFIFLSIFTVKGWKKRENKRCYLIWHMVICIVALAAIVFMALMNGFRISNLLY